MKVLIRYKRFKLFYWKGCWDIPYFQHREAAWVFDFGPLQLIKYYNDKPDERKLK